MKQAAKIRLDETKKRFLLECKRLERIERAYWRAATGVMAELSLSVAIGVGITIFLTGLCFFIKMHGG